MATDTADIQKKTLHSFIDAWGRWDAADMIEHMSEDSFNRIRPYSLGLPARNKAENVEVIPKLTQTVTDYKVRVACLKTTADSSFAYVLRTLVGGLLTVTARGPGSSP